MGDGGVGVFVGAGEKYRYGRSVEGYAEVSSADCSSLRNERDNSDEYDGKLEGLLLCGRNDSGVIVSAQVRWEKQPDTRG